MKTKIVVSELTHDDLTNLLSVALTGSNWACATYDHDIYDTLTNTMGKCWEDKMADILLAGHKITIKDYEADDVSYSDKCVGFHTESGAAIYEICLDDILNTASTKEGFKLLEETLSGEGDFYTADAFLQRVVFGEEVYG